MPADYDLNDVLKPVRDGLSHDGKLYALPFYAESSMTFYRKDLFDKAGLKMPDQPTYDQIKEFAAKLHDRRTRSTACACAASRAGARTWPSSARW